MHTHTPLPCAVGISSVVEKLPSIHKVLGSVLSSSGSGVLVFCLPADSSQNSMPTALVVMTVSPDSKSPRMTPTFRNQMSRVGESSSHRIQSGSPSP